MLDQEPHLPEGYNANHLLIRDPKTKTFDKADPKDFRALVPSPAFADNWAELALQQDPHANLLTASLDLSNGCPIGVKRICGLYCFAFNAWSPGSSAKPNIVQDYVSDMELLREKQRQLGIFVSYNSEPLAPFVRESTVALLRAVLDHPPTDFLLHSRTAHMVDPEIRDLLKDVRQATTLTLGIAIETDDENFLGRQHYHSVEARMRALEELSGDGHITQLTTTPLLGYRDYRGLVKRARQAGVNRIMLGKLKFNLKEGGAEAARKLQIEIEKAGFPPISEEEALEICAEYSFPGGAEKREKFYVVGGNN